MHTTGSSLVAIAQYFWRIRTSLLYGNQQKFNIEANIVDRPIYYIWLKLQTTIRRFDSRFDSNGNFRFADL